MTKEDKQLLLTDLCSRLPYGVICQMENELIINDSPFYDYTLSERHIELFRRHKGFYIKPYLRPMSSMTREELHECQEILGTGVEIGDVLISLTDSSIKCFSYLELDNLFKWLNKKMFDYRELIPKGLALYASEEIYNI